MKLKNFFAILFIILLGLLVYLATTKGIGGNINSSSAVMFPPFMGENSAFELSHERSSYATLVALDETGRTDLSEKLADSAAPDAGFYRGRYYSFFPPGLAFVGWPLYKIGQYYGYSLAAAYFVVSIFAVIGLVALYKICQEIFQFQRWLSLFTVASTGFASTYLNFSITFYQHVPSACFLLVGFYCAWRYGRHHNWAWAAVSWSLYGIASFFDYPNLILYTPVLLYLIYQGVYASQVDGKLKLGVKNSLVFSAIFLVIFGIGHMYYNQVNFESWTKFSNALPRYNPRAYGNAPDELNPAEIERIAREKNNVTFALKETSLANGFFVLLFDIDKSLLLHMPIFLLGIFGLWKVRKKIDMEVFTVLLIIAVNILLYSSFFDPWGGWGFGPRYLVTCMPFISIVVGFWLQNGGLWKRLLVFPIVIYSAGAAILGAVTKNFLVPKVEVLNLNLPYKVWSEFKFLKINQNGTLLYNEFFSSRMSLTEYYIWILSFVVFLFLVILFILPYLKYGNQNQ
jgi:hypothetical protein